MDTKTSGRHFIAGTSGAVAAALLPQALTGCGGLGAAAVRVPPWCGQRRPPGRSGDPVDTCPHPAIHRGRGPDLAWADTSRRGYLLLTVTAGSTQGEFVFVDSVKTRTYSSAVGKTITVQSTGAVDIR